MADTRIPKQLMYGQLADGSRKREHPKLRYKDTLKASMIDCLIDPDTWEQTASDRPAWRLQVWKGVSHYEQDRIAKKKELRRRLKANEANRSHKTA